MTAIAVTLVIVTIACVACASLFDRTWFPPAAELPRMQVVTRDTGARPAPYDMAPRQIVPARSFPVHEHQTQATVHHAPS